MIEFCHPKKGMDFEIRLEIQNWLSSAEIGQSYKSGVKSGRFNNYQSFQVTATEEGIVPDHVRWLGRIS